MSPTLSIGTKMPTLQLRPTVTIYAFKKNISISVNQTQTEELRENEPDYVTTKNATSAMQKTVENAMNAGIRNTGANAKKGRYQYQIVFKFDFHSGIRTYYQTPTGRGRLGGGRSTLKNEGQLPRDFQE